MTVHLAFGILVFEALPLIERMLPLGQCHLYLYQPLIIEKKPYRDNGESVFLHLTLHPVEFFSVEKQYSFTQYLVVVAGSKIVGGDGEVLDQHLAAHKVAIGIVHADFSQSDGFDFSTQQYNPCYEFFNKFVVETGPLVPDVNILLKRCLHGCKNSKRAGGMV